MKTLEEEEDVCGALVSLVPNPSLSRDCVFLLSHDFFLQGRRAENEAGVRERGWRAPRLPAKFTLWASLAENQ